MTKTTATTTTKREQAAADRNAKREAAALEKLHAVAFSASATNTAADALVQYVNEHGATDGEAARLIYALGDIVTHNKLNALDRDDRTYHPIHRTIKAGVTAAQCDGYATRADYIADRLNALIVTEYNADGEAVTKCTDRLEEKRLLDALAECNELSLGGDLRQAAALAILDVLKQAPHPMPADYFRAPFRVLIPSLSVYRDGTPKPRELWEYTYTNHIKEVGKAVGRALNAERERVDTTKPLDDVYTEIETDSGEVVEVTTYRAASFLAVSDVYDFNGKVTAQVVDKSTNDLVKRLLTGCNFSRVEAQIFRAMFCTAKPATFEQIADRLRISVGTVKSHYNRILSKVVASGIIEGANPTTAADLKEKRTAKPAAVKCYRAADCKNGDTTAAPTLYTFPSVSRAAKVLGLSKGHISEQLKGKRQTVGDFIFRYATA